MIDSIRPSRTCIQQTLPTVLNDAERRASHQLLKDGDVGQGDVTLGSELRKERPAVRRRARSLAGLRTMMAVADSLVEYQDQRGHRVLDGRPAELGLPLVVARSTRPAVIIPSGR